MENLLVEVLDEEGKPAAEGEVGDVVITDLTNFGMPFIRYRNGDRAVAGWGACRCGRGLHVLRQVSGRQLDVLRTVDGRLVPGEFFPHLLKDYAGIRRFQVTQESPERVVLRLVVSPQWQPAAQCGIEEACREVLGPEVAFEVQEVAEIPLTAAGKQRVVVNLCRQETDRRTEAACG